MSKRCMDDIEVSEKRPRIESAEAIVEAANEAANEAFEASAEAIIEAANEAFEAVNEAVNEVVLQWDKQENKNQIIAKLFTALSDFDTEAAKECWCSGICLKPDDMKTFRVPDLLMPTECDCTIESVISYLLGELYVIKLIWDDTRSNLKWRSDDKQKPKVCPPHLATVFVQDMLKLPQFKKNDLYEYYAERSLDIDYDLTSHLKRWNKPHGAENCSEYWQEGELEAFVAEYKITCAAIAEVFRTDKV